MKKILSVIVLILALFYLFRIYRIDGTSMNYGLIENNMIISYRQFSSIERGDLLVIKHPLDPENRLYIKRCAALPGDIYFERERSFYLQIDGNSSKTGLLADSHDLESFKTEQGYFLKDPYLKYYGVVPNWRLTVPKVLTELPVTKVKKDHYLMLGDYRDNSADNRFFGAVPRSWIFSKVIFIFKVPRSWSELINIKEADKEDHS